MMGNEPTYYSWHSRSGEIPSVMSFYAFLIWAVALWSILIGLVDSSFVFWPSSVGYALLTAITFVPVYAFIVCRGTMQAREYRWRIEAEESRKQ
jgi:hypothetical protein